MSKNAERILLLWRSPVKHTNVCHFLAAAKRSILVSRAGIGFEHCGISRTYQRIFDLVISLTAL